MPRRGADQLPAKETYVFVFRSHTAVITNCQRREGGGLKENGFLWWSCCVSSGVFIQPDQRNDFNSCELLHNASVSTKSIVKRAMPD